MIRIGYAVILLLIFRLHETALDPHTAIGLKTDKHTGLGDIIQSIKDGSIVESFKFGLDFPETFIHFLGQVFILIDEITLFDPGQFVSQRVLPGRFIL